MIEKDKMWLKQTMVEAEVKVDMLVSQSAMRKGIKKFAAYLIPSDLRQCGARACACLHVWTCVDHISALNV